MTWTEHAAAIIRPIVAQGIKDGLDDSAIRKALRAAYPFGPRAHWPYKAWCAEVNRQLGRRMPRGDFACRWCKDAGCLACDADRQQLALALSKCQETEENANDDQ